MKKNRVLIIIILLVILLIGYIYVYKCSYINDPLFLIIGWPAELQKPVFKEFIDFGKAGYTKEIKAAIKFPHTYEFEIYDENGKIKSSFKYLGIIRIEFLKNNVIKAVVRSKDSYCGVYAPGFESFQTVVIANSSIDLRGEVLIRIIVEKADPDVKKLGNKIFLTMDGAPGG